MKSRGSKLQVGARAEARSSHQQVNQTTLCMLFSRHNAQQLPDWPAEEEKLSVHRLAKKYSIPYTTLYKRINNWVTGYEHWSGGRGNSRIIPKVHEGKLN